MSKTTSTMPLTVQQAEDFFDKMDQNSDGKCTIQEVKKYLQEFCVQHYGSMSDAEFAVSTRRTE